MPELGRKYTCYSCHTKFYDLGKPVPLCPKCGADQRDADDTPVYTTSRGRAAAARVAPIVDDPVEDDDMAPAAPAAADAESEDEEDFVADPREEPEEEEEEY